MTKKILLTTAALWLIASSVFAQRTTVFQTSFEYGSFEDEPVVFEPLDLNGADNQIGEWSGLEIPLGSGTGQYGEDAVGFANNPYDGGRILFIDRVGGELETGANYKGSIDANLSDPILLLGAEISFQVGSRRTTGNHQKDFDIVGLGSDGNESFRLRVGTNNNGGERLGYVTNDGADVVFDLPTVVGDDGPADLNNTGFNGGLEGPYPDAPGGPGVNNEFTDVKLSLSGNGWVIDLFHNELNTSVEANAYTSAVLPYNGDAMDLAVVQFGFAGGSDGWNSGSMYDNITITGFEEILQGDFNSNGELDFDDYLALAANLGGTGPAGDYDFNGVVDLADFAQLKTAFAAQAAAPATVPEPNSFALLALGLVGFLARRRRRR